MRYYRISLIVLVVIGALVPFRVFAQIKADPGAGRQSLPTGLSVALLKSAYTSRYFAEKWQYEQVIYEWLTFLAQNGVKHRLITDSDLEHGEMDDFTVLVLPAAICLSEEERSSIIRFLSDGGGVVASWAVGVRFRDGEWAGWSLLEELTESRFTGYLSGRPATWVTLSGRSPLSVGLGPGFKLELIGGWKVGLEGASGGGYWSDYNMRPWRLDEKPQPDMALANTVSGRGRVVWLGFNISEVIHNPANQTALEKLLLNSISWVGRGVMTHVWHWPNNHRAAAVFSQDVEYLFHHAENSVRVLKEERIPGTFFCVSDLAQDNQELIKEFAEIGEVGTHSDNHEQFEGQPFRVQYERLERSAGVLADMGETDVKGFRPPYELCDEATLRAWAMLGGEYIFGQPEYRPRMMPELVRIPRDPTQGLDEEKTLVLIPRAVRDDHSTMVVEERKDNDDIFRQHRSDMERVYELSGLCMFGYHSNLLCLPERVGVLSDMIGYAKTLDLWLATAGDIADWWRKRSSTSADVTMGPAGTLLVSARNEGIEALEKLSVVVFLPRKTSQVQITCESVDVPIPEHTLEGDRLVVHIENLEAGSIQTYAIELL